MNLMDISGIKYVSFEELRRMQITHGRWPVIGSFGTQTAP